MSWLDQSFRRPPGAKIMIRQIQFQMRICTLQMFYTHFEQLLLSASMLSFVVTQNKASSKQNKNRNQKKFMPGNSNTGSERDDDLSAAPVRRGPDAHAGTSSDEWKEAGTSAPLRRGAGRDRRQSHEKRPVPAPQHSGVALFLTSQKSDAMLYAPSIDDIEENCENVSLKCYMLELIMVLDEEEVKGNKASCILAFNDHLDSGSYLDNTG
ncbi:hypothetical protein F2P81_010149 [Scophthalmus maximus]|uniref:Uncharacterized protein n=1 Tax=Scophthalmus maximus TaxID=52904 RepID=A0A6A4SX19_SCOMX|nr:hypothetical protein F2P81_010149 [Scophthalmus maximus]